MCFPARSHLSQWNRIFFKCIQEHVATKACYHSACCCMLWKRHEVSHNDWEGYAYTYTVHHTHMYHKVWEFYQTIMQFPTFFYCEDTTLDLAITLQKMIAKCEALQAKHHFVCQFRMESYIVCSGWLAFTCAILISWHGRHMCGLSVVEAPKTQHTKQIPKF